MADTTPSSPLINSSSLEQRPSVSFQSNFSWTFTGNVIYLIAQWIALGCIVKLGTPIQVGQFTLGLSIASPIIFLMNLGLRQAMITDARHDFLFTDYFWLRIYTTVIGVLLICGIALLGKFSAETTQVIMLSGIFRATEAVSEILHGLFQQQERMDIAARSVMARGILSAACLCILMAFTRNIVWGTAGFIMGSLLVLVNDFRNTCIFCSPCNSILHQFPDVTIVRVLSITTLPLGMTFLITALNASVPRYFIQYYQGEATLGIFAALTYLMITGRIVVSASGSVISPRLADYYARRDLPQFKRLMVQLIALAVVVGSAGVLLALVAGKPILRLIYQPEYAAYNDLLIGLCCVNILILVDLFLCFGLTAVRFFKIQPISNLISLILTALVCVLLIPQYGLTGGLWGLFIGAFSGVLIDGAALWFAIQHESSLLAN
jgi:O-antigen/teichoic acid export membrane protein